MRCHIDWIQKFKATKFKPTKIKVNIFLYIALTENSTLPLGRQFMLNLLVRSLIADGGIEEAIMTAILEVEVSVDSSKERPIIADMAATPILQLVQQLLNNLTIQQLTYFKQVKVDCG